MSILAKYHTYHLVYSEPEMTKAEQIVFDILDELRTATPFNIYFEDLSEEKQGELLEALVEKTNANLQEGLPRICIMGSGDLEIASLHEAMKGMPILVMNDLQKNIGKRMPMEIVRLEIEDLEYDLEALRSKPNKKHTFKKPHSKRGNAWDGMK